MAEHGDGGGGGGGSDVLFFLLVLVILAFIFFASGAAKNARVSSLFTPFQGISGATTTFGTITAPGVDFTGNGRGFDQSETNTITTEIANLKNNLSDVDSLSNSSYAGKISISASWVGRSARAQDEYVVIRASRTNKTGITITGWRIISAVSKISATIPGAVTTYTQGSTGVQEPITLMPGDSAIISSGRSPVGVSFRVNKCSGYLSQFQTFSPPLTSNCPKPQDEFNTQPDRFLFADSDCYDHLARIPLCRIDVTPPARLSQACKNFIYSKITYQACVAAHSADENFDQPEWRVYLGSNAELWRREREAVVLVDLNGKLVDNTIY